MKIVNREPVGVYDYTPSTAEQIELNNIIQASSLSPRAIEYRWRINAETNQVFLSTHLRMNDLNLPIQCSVLTINASMTLKDLREWSMFRGKLIECLSALERKAARLNTDHGIDVVSVSPLATWNHATQRLQVHLILSSNGIKEEGSFTYHYPSDQFV